MTDTANVLQPGCRVAEILQHTCRVDVDKSGNRVIHCFPVPRVILLCRKQPAVEVTSHININVKTGEVELPQNLSITPRSWGEVQRGDSAK